MADFFDTIVIGYLASHIPITLFVDCQALFPRTFYPSPVKNMLAWYVDWSKDPLMNVDSGNTPVWFRSIIAAEFLLQVPYFCIALYAWLKRKEYVAGLSIRTATIAYGAHTATTLLPILATFMTDPSCSSTKWMLTLIYIPYLIMPLSMLWRCADRTFLFPTGTATKSSGNSKKGK